MTGPATGFVYWVRACQGIASKKSRRRQEMLCPSASWRSWQQSRKRRQQARPLTDLRPAVQKRAAVPGRRTPGSGSSGLYRPKFSPGRGEDGFRQLFCSCSKIAKEGELLLSLFCLPRRDLAEKKPRIKAVAGIRLANDRFPAGKPERNDSDLNNRLRKQSR